MNESLDDKIFYSIKNKEFNELSKKITSEHDSKFLYEAFNNSIKKYLFDNEELFYHALLEIHPSNPQNKEFWLEAIKKPQFLQRFGWMALFESSEKRKKWFELYDKQLVIKSAKDLLEPNFKINFISIEEYLSKEHQQSLKEHQRKIISDEYKDLLNDYTFSIKEEHEEFIDICPYCKEKLAKTTLPNVKGEYESCQKDKIIFLNLTQNLRIFDGWTINQLFN